MIVMDRKNDDDRVGSRKMIRLATVAAPCPTAPGDVRRNAAVRAEAVAPVPVQKAAGAGIDRGLAFRKGCGDMEDRLTQPQFRRGRGSGKETSSEGRGEGKECVGSLGTVGWGINKKKK